MSNETQDYFGSPRFYSILNTTAQLHSAKNHDYATDSDPFSNFRESEALGIPAWKGCFIRLGDKYKRLQNIASDKVMRVTHETAADTLLDLAVYAVICLALLEEARAGAAVESSLYRDSEEPEIEPVPPFLREGPRR